MEMQLTEGIAKTLTEPVDSGAAHHLAHFIPKDVLRSFEAEVQAKRAGLKTSTKDQYAENKLDESNSGYRLLQKQGWTEGAGLGAQGSGVTVPINGGLVRPAKTGLGQQLGDNVDAAEDDIEVYRKRMMLAYKYRPNPLNNPRRPY
ncbi:uncharacterized protein EV422DRAFT_403729 [Fimicolochytrium jonesii]|uniref:uncharacterized protein n=1 Tax=Fimicolochytrium jonesii TaxID=1396493 RepID=UPI0022FEB648|nr:uncharacterized protein EV422DRAFT_403729 [Fimicolochytrium jonesii]KAI8822565.1 hypothetical protein EV422DRAFT_403729 [Fimicolochytrium jonesii]